MGPATTYNMGFKAPLSLRPNSFTKRSRAKVHELLKPQER